MEAKSSSRCHSTTTSSGLQGSGSRRGRAAAALEAPTPCTTHCYCCYCCSPSQVKRQQHCCYIMLLTSRLAPGSDLNQFAGQMSCSMLTMLSAWQLLFFRPGEAAPIFCWPTH